MKSGVIGARPGMKNAALAEYFLISTEMVEVIDVHPSAIQISAVTIDLLGSVPTAVLI